MNDVLTFCMAIAIALGASHAVYVYLNEINEFQGALRDHPIMARVRAGYYAVWTLLLWGLLGTTVVVYWMIAVIPYLIARATGRPRLV